MFDDIQPAARRIYPRDIPVPKSLHFDDSYYVLMTFINQRRHSLGSTIQSTHGRYALPMSTCCLYFTVTFLASRCVLYLHDALMLVTPDGLHMLLCDLVNEPFNNINSLALFKRTWTEVF